MNTQINLYSPYLSIDAYYVKNCSLVQILWVARHFFNMRFLAILPPLAMAIFALCHPTGVHVTRPKMLRLTNGFWEGTSNLAGHAFRGVRHYSILFYSTKLVPQEVFCPWHQFLNLG